MAEYTDFPDSPEAGDLVDKNGRTWYYDSVKWVLYSDPKNSGDIVFRDESPIVVERDEESTNNPLDPDESRPVITTGIDLKTLTLLDG